MRLLLSDDNICKLFGPRSGLTKCQAWSGFKLFELMVFLKYIFENIYLKKKLVEYKKACKITQHAELNWDPIPMTL